MTTEKINKIEAFLKSISSIPDEARVWIYQADRLFSINELNEINLEMQFFVKNWKAHDNQLTAFSLIAFERFILLFVDEKDAHVSGCSIDKSLGIIKELGIRFGINFFDRMQFVYQFNNDFYFANPSQINALINEGKLSGQSLVFNNLVQTSAELKHNWLMPLKETWLQRYL